MGQRVPVRMIHEWMLMKALTPLFVDRSISIDSVGRAIESANGAAVDYSRDHIGAFVQEVNQLNDTGIIAEALIDGAPFDPNIHELLVEETEPSEGEAIINLLPIWKFKGSVVMKAKVIIAS